METHDTRVVSSTSSFLPTNVKSILERHSNVPTSNNGDNQFPKKWINETWDNFVSSYLDDVLIYTQPTKDMTFGSTEHNKLHAQHVRRFLLALQHADLRISATQMI